jgi:CheY-like chemotaxis protein
MEQTADELEQTRAASTFHAHGEMLMQSQRTELVHDLAGALGNQFNNIMMAITSYAELELKKATPSQQRSLEQILANTARATRLIQTFLAFTRKNAPDPGTIAFNPLVDRICQLLQPLLGEEVNVSLTLDPSVGTVAVDPTQIEQLILILGAKARESFSRGGNFEVSTQLLYLEAGSGAEVKTSGQYAMLSLQFAPPADSIGESCLTLKQDISLAQTISEFRTMVSEQGGHIRVFRSPQETKFRVYLPSTSIAISSNDARESNATHSASTILIVDDDDAVRNSAAEFLKMEGFKVLQARTGPEALRIVQDSRSHPDLLITDIVMAGMHGDKVAEELRKVHPGLKTLFMSGDSHEAAKVIKDADAQLHLLQKPFRLNKLNDKIHELLGV